MVGMPLTNQPESKIQREFNASFAAPVIPVSLIAIEFDFDQLHGGWPLVQVTHDFGLIETLRILDNRTLLQAADDCVKSITCNDDDKDAIHKALECGFQFYLTNKMDKAV